MGEAGASGPRCAAIVGPYLSGKTMLSEALLFGAGAITRKGSVRDGNTVGDSSPVARAREMSTELSVGQCKFLDDDWSLIDCPGSIEFGQDARNALMIADVAVIVCEPDVSKIPGLAPLFKLLDENSIPHLVFINKMDNFEGRVSDVLDALQAVSQRPLILRQVPIIEGNDVTGYVDLISKRAYEYKPGQNSALIQLPEAVRNEEEEARQGLLESLADFDDGLLEQLLEDVVPDSAEIYHNLSENLAADNIVPVMLGSGETQSGIFRLWKALRHDTPGVSQTAERRGFAPGNEPVAQVFKTVHAAHAGKLSLVRVLQGQITEGSSLGGARVGAISKLLGPNQSKVSKASAGDVVALGRMEALETGNVLTPGGRGEGGDPWPETLTPVYAMTIEAKKREDEVKLSGAVHRLIEEDPSYQLENNPDTHELVLWGQGEIHLAVAKDNLAEKYNIEVKTRRPQVPYKETIRKPVEQHARHKKQSGGHGQFGDVKIEIKPLPRGSGFAFSDKIVGGAVPRQFIPSVEAGVRAYLDKGPLGFPVVDLSVRLLDGQFHAVDSSDMAFRAAAGLAMREGLPSCSPVLLEPISKVEIDMPSEHTSKINTLITGRRGQILGFDSKAGWDGWDTVQAYMPLAEMHGLIIDLRSLSQGAGTFRFEVDHMAELTGRDAEMVISSRQEADAA